MGSLLDSADELDDDVRALHAGRRIVQGGRAVDETRRSADELQRSRRISRSISRSFSREFPPTMKTPTPWRTNPMPQPRIAHFAQKYPGLVARLRATRKVLTTTPVIQLSAIDQAAVT